MSSRSASPSITNFFKPQRKRPRGSKDDGGMMTASKKLLLEEGISVSKGGGGGGGGGSSLVLDKAPKTQPVKESTTTELVIGKPKEVEVGLVKRAEGEQYQHGLNNNKPPKAAAPPSSPVKFLKVGALSPGKKRKLTTEQVAKLLKKKTNLKDLKSTLEKLNQCTNKIDEFHRSVAEARAASPAKIRSVEEAVVHNSPRTVVGLSPAKFYSPTADRVNADLARLSATKVTSPSKLVRVNNKVKKRLFDGGQGSEQQQQQPEGDRKTVPAYQRFHNLAQKTPAETGIPVEELDLPLPFHFKILEELFIAVDTVAMIMKGRKEMITFPRLKSGVLELFRRVSLREKHFAQMVTVLPDCYTFGLEKIGPEHHLKINVDDLLPSVLTARRKAFRAGLIRICLEQHQKFLLGLVPPIVVPADKQITRWHPQFKIDELPDIVPIENALPVKPAPDKLSTAREVIAKAQNILENANPRMKQAVKNLLNNAAEGETVQNPTVAVAPPKSASTIKALKGVSQSLLEKIRNRERQKTLNEMTRTPTESKQLQMVKRLPNFIKIIRNIIVAEKKVALPLDTVIDRVSHSIQNMAPVDSDAHIRLLVKLLPQWIKIIKLSNSDGEYLKIDKNADVNELMHEMDDIIKKYSS